MRATPSPDVDHRLSLVDEIVLDAWAIARWANEANRALTNMTDQASVAPLQSRLIEALDRLQSMEVGIRSAHDDTTSRRLRHTQPVELDEPTPELERLADTIHAHRLALDEIERSAPGREL